MLFCLGLPDGGANNRTTAAILADECASFIFHTLKPQLCWAGGRFVPWIICWMDSVPEEKPTFVKAFRRTGPELTVQARPAEGVGHRAPPSFPERRNEEGTTMGARIKECGYLYLRLCYPQKYKWTVTALLCYSSSRSMRNCMNISTTSWPTMAIAKATRHSRYNPGCAFSQRLSHAPIGQRLEGSLDSFGVSRF